jgi:arginyl-tRNA synthetase
MNLFAEIRNLVVASLQHMQVQGNLPAGLIFDAVTVEPPRDLAHGDMATNGSGKTLSKKTT